MGRAEGGWRRFSFLAAFPPSEKDPAFEVGRRGGEVLEGRSEGEEERGTEGLLDARRLDVYLRFALSFLLTPLSPPPLLLLPSSSQNFPPVKPHLQNYHDSHYLC